MVGVMSIAVPTSMVMSMITTRSTVGLSSSGLSKPTSSLGRFATVIIQADTIAAAAVSAWLITVANIPGQVVALLQPLHDNPKWLMAAIMVLVMIVGTALDMAPTILILTPVLMPLVNAAGIDPVYFGVLFMINNAIGLVTPPVGVVLNTVAGVGKVSMDAVTRGVVPFMIAQFILMFLMVLFPQLVLVPARWFY
jgi:tripartite ATP-independent transporter DctM subunit